MTFFGMAWVISADLAGIRLDGTEQLCDCSLFIEPSDSWNGPSVKRSSDIKCSLYTFQAHLNSSFRSQDKSMEYVPFRDGALIEWSSIHPPPQIAAFQSLPVHAVQLTDLNFPTTPFRLTFWIRGRADTDSTIPFLICQTRRRRLPSRPEKFVVAADWC
jgi:hypothetical protein